MVDIHSHILPGVDDGSQDIENSIEMLNLAVASNVKAVVLTPHVNLLGSGQNFALDLIPKFEQFKQEVDNRNIGIDLYFGGENYATPDILNLAANRMLPTINNTRFILVEFDFGERISNMCSVLNGLSQMGYAPIVAHPERYDVTNGNIAVVRNMMNCGALMQINKGSLVGNFGANCQNTAWDLIYTRMVHFVASDSHNIKKRNPVMDEIYDMVKREISANYADGLFDINPAIVLRNGIVPVPIPRI